MNMYVTCKVCMYDMYVCILLFYYGNDGNGN